MLWSLSPLRGLAKMSLAHIDDRRVPARTAADLEQHRAIRWGHLRDAVRSCGPERSRIRLERKGARIRMHCSLRGGRRLIGRYVFRDEQDDVSLRL